MSYQNNLIGDKRFWPMFWTQFFGAFNDNVFKNALVILITYKSYQLMGLSPEQMVTLCGGIFILPFFIFSATAGQLCDKYSKSNLIFIVKIFEIVVMILGACGFVFENLPLLLFSLFLMGFQSTLFGPVKYSILPELIEEDELVHGNALVEMGTFLSILLGTIVGGVLISYPQGGVYVSISVILFAIIGAIFAKCMTPIKSNSPNLQIQYGLIKPSIDILKVTKEIKSVWNSVLGISWFWFLGAALLSIFPVYAKNVLFAGESVVTLFLALFSVGVAIGSILCEKFSKHRLELGLVPFGSIGITLFILDLSFVGHPFAEGTTIGSIKEFMSYPISYRIVIDLLLISVFSGFFIVPLYTFIQQHSHPESRSRVIAGNNIINALFMVVSSIALAAFYGWGLDVVQILLILAMLNAIVAFYIYTIIPEFLLRFCCVIFTRMIYRLRIQGLDNIPHDGAAVLTCNHVSFVDWLFIGTAIKRPVRFVMYYTFLKLPFIGFFFRGAKVIPIAGKNEDFTLMEEAFVKIKEALDNGELVCIFPEGNITKDGKIDGFRPGVEKIIQNSPVPVIPMKLEGLWGSFFSRKYGGKALSNPKVILKTLWSKITLVIADPVAAENVSAKHLENITRELKSDT
ncbi:MFS transporter [Bacteriovoracaceae bacterium]|nr:MFS transporter [Bacteriovoracaceae bacterium]